MGHVRLLPLGGLLLAALAAHPFPTSAQETGPRGFWLSGGGGGGWRLDGTEFASDHHLGRSGYLRLGGTVSHSLRLGAEFVGSWTDATFNTQTRHNLTFAALYSVRGSFFLKGGAGFSFATSVDVEGPPEPPGFGDVAISVSGSDVDLGLTTGVGIDLALSPALALTPNVDLLWTGLTRNLQPYLSVSLGLTVR